MKNRGFTLIELLMVIVILAVMVGLSAPNFNQSFQRLELKKAAENIVYMIRWAQTRAAQDNVDYQLEFSDDDRHYRILREDTSENSSTKKFVTIPIHMGRSIALPGSVSIADPKNMIIHPDGSLDKIRLTLNGRRGKLVISSMEQRGNLFILEES